MRQRALEELELVVSCWICPPVSLVFTVDLFMSEDFREVVGGKPVDLATAEAAMKTLFGMVVKERRRVASLAKAVGTFEARAGQLEREKEKEREERDDMKRKVDVDRANFS